MDAEYKEPFHSRLTKKNKGGDFGPVSR